MIKTFPHQDKTLFVEALNFTSSQTGFRQTLIEKDYYCSLVLSYFFDLETNLVFKGGTCLNKVFSGFYRLSEDLDFTIPVDSMETRTNRRKLIGPVKKHFLQISNIFKCFRIKQELVGANVSTQYIGGIEYLSSITEKNETIKIEVALREPLFVTAKEEKASTLLINPFTLKSFISPFPVITISKKEAFAEKIRAALSRKEPAIRDYYDLFYAIKENIISINDSELLRLATEKLVFSNGITLNEKSLSVLKRQLITELKPVLRDTDFNAFNLEETMSEIQKIVEKLEYQKRTQ
jgi:predicted nucleotidyltransferase component of viral defense system